MFLHRTNRGRIVYNRKPHVFGIRDAERILDSLEISQLEMNLWDIWVKLSLRLFDLVNQLPTQQALDAELSRVTARWGETGLDFQQFLQSWLQHHAASKEE
jgi:hypothetical protein